MYETSDSRIFFINCAKVHGLSCIWIQTSSLTFFFLAPLSPQYPKLPPSSIILIFSNINHVIYYWKRFRTYFAPHLPYPHFSSEQTSYRNTLSDFLCCFVVPSFIKFCFFFIFRSQTIEAWVLMLQQFYIFLIYALILNDLPIFNNTKRYTLQ